MDRKLSLAHRLSRAGYLLCGFDPLFKGLTWIRCVAEDVLLKGVFCAVSFRKNYPGPKNCSKSFR